jgi:hypothetical protein
MAVHCSQHERGDAELAAGPGVDLSTVSQQQLDDVDVTSGRGQGEWRVVRHVPVLLVGVPAKQSFDDFVPAAGAGQR